MNESILQKKFDILKRCLTVLRSSAYNDVKTCKLHEYDGLAEARLLDARFIERAFKDIDALDPKPRGD